MLNPWLAFSFKAARFGWETQSIMVDQMMRLAALDRHEAHDASSMASPEDEPTVPAARKSAEAQTSPETQTLPEAQTRTPVHAIKEDKPGKVAQPVSNGHKKQDRASKRRRSK
jgi:hypothetical protein